MEKNNRAVPVFTVKKSRIFSALLQFSRAIDRLSATAGAIATGLVLLAVLVSAGNATMRYVMSASSNAWLEVQWYMFGAIVLLGGAHTLRKNEHVRVDIVYASLSNRGKLWVDSACFVLFFLPVTLTLTYLCTPFFLRSFQTQEATVNADGLLLWPIKLMLPLGFCLLTLQGFSELVKRLGALNGFVLTADQYQKPLQ